MEDPNGLTVPTVHTDLGLSSFSVRRAAAVLGVTLSVALFASAVGVARGRGEAARRPASRPVPPAPAQGEPAPSPILLSDASPARR